MNNLHEWSQLRLFLLEWSQLLGVFSLKWSSSLAPLNTDMDFSLMSISKFYIICRFTKNVLDSSLAPFTSGCWTKIFDPDLISYLKITGVWMNGCVSWPFPLWFLKHLGKDCRDADSSKYNFWQRLSLCVAHCDTTFVLDIDMEEDLSCYFNHCFTYSLPSHWVTGW